MSTWSARSNMQSAPRSISRFSIRRPFRSCAKAPCRAAETTFAGISLEDTAACCLQGTVRKVNEDRWAIQTKSLDPDGSMSAFLGVYDGHGGFATSDWLDKNLFSFVQDAWAASKDPEQAITKAFQTADSVLLSPTGWMGMGERGVGGSKCGSTAAVSCIYQEEDGTVKLLTANAGDSRVVISRGGEAVQLTTDHVPDDEEERERIEAQNPNPKLPLVRYVGKTWRVGGVLALSRAFGDAYMKSSLQFEGVVAGSDGYSSGFGVTAKPSVRVEVLGPEDTWVIVCSDGLLANEERGGGGGLSNQQAIDICNGATGCSAQEVADELCKAAQAQGSTDDVTVALMRLRL